MKAVVLFILLQVSIYCQPAEFYSLGGRYNEFTQSTTWTPYQTLDLTQPLIYLSIIQTKTGKVVLFVNAQYVGNDWVFMKDIILLAGNEPMTFKLESFTRKVLSNGNVFEHGAHPIGTDENKIAFLKRLATSGKVRVRYDGKYIHDKNLNPEEIRLISKYITAYDQYLTNHKTAEPSKRLTPENNVLIGAIGFFATILIVAWFLIRDKRKQQRLKDEYFNRNSS